MHRQGHQPFKANPITSLAAPQKFLVTLHISRVDLGNLGLHRISVTRGPKRCAVLPADIVKRINATQIDILVKIATTRGPQVFVQLRHCDNRGPQIKAVTILGDR